jgi:hypothetical protein
MATQAATVVADAVDGLTSQLHDLTVTSSTGPEDGAQSAASSTPLSSSTLTQAQAKKDTVPPLAKPAATGGGLSATVPGRQWIMGHEAFEAKMPHHEGIKALWETKWKFPCSKSLYPFHDGKFEDFEPIFNFLIEVSTPFPSSHTTSTNALLPRTTSTTAPPPRTLKPSFASPTTSSTKPTRSSPQATPRPPRTSTSAPAPSTASPASPTSPPSPPSTTRPSGAPGRPRRRRT